MLSRRKPKPAVSFSIDIYKAGKLRQFHNFYFVIYRRCKLNPQFPEGAALLFTITNIVDAGGNPATLPGPVSWTSSDTTILTLTPAADGLTATGTSTKTGVVTVTATSGTLSASVAVTVTAGAAVSFQISVSLAPTAPAPTPAG